MTALTVILPFEQSSPMGIRHRVRQSVLSMSWWRSLSTHPSKHYLKALMNLVRLRFLRGLPEGVMNLLSPLMQHSCSGSLSPPQH